MRLSRGILIVMIVGSLSTLVLSCGPKQNSAAAAQDQVVTVQRGDLSIDITAAGNLALSQKEDLAFEIPGTVEEVLVKEGNSVVEGQVLARLDTSEWEKQVTALTRQVTIAERQVTSAQKQLRDKQTAVTTAENQVISKEYALRQAQLDLKTAQNALEDIADVKKVQDKIDDAEQTLRVAQSIVAGNFSVGMPLTLESYWSNLVRAAQDELIQLRREKQAVLAGTGLTASDSEAVALDIAKKQLAVEQKQFGIKQVQFELDNTKQAVLDAQSAIAPAQEDLRNAQDDLKIAQESLADAKSKGPEVKAPFAGFITKVSVKGGDEVKKGTVAVTIADSTKFQADVLVNEMDISKVKLGGTASVELQSMSGTSLSANITYIAPTATVQQGVVNYKVTVELASLQPATQVQQRASANVTSANASVGASGTPGGRAFGSGNLTQEQMRQMAQQRQQATGQVGRGGQAFGGANLTREQISQMAQQRQQAMAGQTGGQSSSQSQVSTRQSSRQSQTAAVSASSIRLAEGMTVTVTIPVDSRTNVLLVRNRAISRSGRQTTVKVVKDGVTETRSITTGLSDGTYTEVISGLSEGEQVVIPQTTATPTSSQPRPPGGIMIPGIGGR